MNCKIQVPEREFVVNVTIADIENQDKTAAFVEWPTHYTPSPEEIAYVDARVLDLIHEAHPDAEISRSGWDGTREKAMHALGEWIAESDPEDILRADRDAEIQARIPRVARQTYVDCPHCGEARDTEGDVAGEEIFCDSCHKPFILVPVSDSSESSVRRPRTGAQGGTENAI